MCKILRVLVFVRGVFFILIRNLDLQKGVCCVKLKEISLETDSVRMDKHALKITRHPLFTKKFRNQIYEMGVPCGSPVKNKNGMLALKSKQHERLKTIYHLGVLPMKQRQTSTQVHRRPVSSAGRAPVC